MITPPNGWDSNALTHFFDEQRKNQFATFANTKEANDLVFIDALFMQFNEKANVNPRPWLPMMFFIRSHSVYRGACSLIFAGDSYNVSALLRSMIEAAAYGIYIGKDVDKAEAWLRRHDSPELEKKMKNLFTIKKIKEHLKAEAPKLEKGFTELYNRFVDYGGHPNERGFTSNMQKVERDGSTHYLTNYLSAEGVSFPFALKSVAQAGLWVLLCYRLIYREKFSLLGISDELDALRQRY